MNEKDGRSIMSIEKRRLRDAIQRFLTPKTRYVRKKMNGHDMILDLADTWVRNSYLWNDIYEPETSAYIDQHVKNGDVALDIGAHIGYHTLNFAYAGAKVHAFEPDHDTFKLLCTNTAIFDSVIPHNIIISDIKGEMTFFKSLQNSVWSSILPQPNSIPIKLQSTTVDDLRFPKIDWLKIDVEGAEIHVLRGMKKTLARFPDLKLIIEWLPKNGGDFEGLLSILNDWSCKPMDHNMLFWRNNYC